MKLSDKTIFFLVLVALFAFLIRIIWLDRIPPALYTDEANQGYNAYSILQTGKDEHGEFLPVSFRSFGDWKPPLSTYLTVPFVYLFGLSEVAVRLPSVLLGTGTIILAFFLLFELLKEQRQKTKISLLASFYLAISPWHILQSRTSMLVVVALFFLMVGVYFFLKGLENKKLLLLSAVGWVLSIYSYYGMRLIVPLLLLALIIYARKKINLRQKEAILSLFLGFLLLLPLILSFLKEPDVVLGRAKTVSVFFDQGINLRKWELATQDGINASTLLTRFYHNNLYMYGRDITRRFLSHFEGKYLLSKGDQSPPFQIPSMGILYIPDIFFIVVGLIWIFKNRFERRYLILIWLIISVLPAAFTFVTPASNRTFNNVLAYGLLVAVGLSYIIPGLIRNSKFIFAIITSTIYAFSFAYFMHNYFVVLPKDHADWWNYGWRQVVDYVSQNEYKYENIIVSDEFGMPYIYFLFYKNFPPAIFQQTAIRPYVADRFGFEHVEGFDKYLFPNEFEWQFTKKNNLQKNTLYVVPARQTEDDPDYIKAIYYPNGSLAFKIFGYE